LIFIFIFFTFLVSRIRTIIIMASWASIVKSRNAIVQENGTRAATTQAATTTQVSTRDQKYQKEIQQQQMEVFKVHKKYLEELEEEDKKMENRMPLYRHITRPDTHPLFAPIFKDLSEKCQWEQEQWRLNQEYSSMIHDQKVAVWEKKNNWFPVPLMTDVSEPQKKMGFIPVIPPSSLYKFGYLCPHNSEEKRHEYLHFLLRLLFNRSEQVCACKTVGEFEKVYLEAMNLTRYSDEEWTPAELKRERKTASNALWALSTKANLFPGKQLTPRDPAPAPEQNVPGVVYKFRNGQKCYEIYGGVGRRETGVCGVKDAKTLGNLAPIRWFISPAEMRNLKKFDFTFQPDPHASSYLYDDFDWSDDGGFGGY
jgi:hypothetical protein